MLKREIYEEERTARARALLANACRLNASPGLVAYTIEEIERQRARELERPRRALKAREQRRYHLLVRDQRPWWGKR